MQLVKSKTALDNSLLKSESNINIQQRSTTCINQLHLYIDQFLLLPPPPSTWDCLASAAQGRGICKATKQKSLGLAQWGRDSNSRTLFSHWCAHQRTRNATRKTLIDSRKSERERWCNRLMPSCEE